MNRKSKIAIAFVSLISLAALGSVAIVLSIFHGVKFSDYDKLRIATVTRTQIMRHVWPSQKFVDIDTLSLFVIPDFDKKEITATEEIKGRLAQGKKLILNLTDDAKILCLKYNGEQLEYHHINNHLIINGSDTSFSLKIKFKTKPNGGLFFTENESGRYIYSVNEPIFASEWFACNDTPRDKFFFRLSARVDTNLSVISNGKISSEKILGKEKIVTWLTKYPIASYSVALYLGKYSCVRGFSKKVEIAVYAYPSDEAQARKIERLAEETLEIFSQKFGRFPFAKEKLAIVESDWNYGGMENQTAICLGTKFFDAEYFKDVIVHEIAHEWFGNCVSVSTWDDVWINEGAATFAEAIYWEAIAGKSGYESAINSFRRFDKHEQIRSREKNLFARVVYEKGAMIFHRLRNMLGDEVFFNALRNYLKGYAYSSAGLTELKTEFEKASGKNLSGVFKAL